MRFGFAASALGLGLVLFAVQRAVTQTATPAPATAPAVATAPAATLTSAAGGSPASAANEAAAKHAKRTACLQDAKTKKLVGAEKSAYLKDCIAAP